MDVDSSAVEIQRHLDLAFWTVVMARMRSNNFSAGSSVGSWGTSLPARREGVSASTCPCALANRISSWSAGANKPATRRSI
jgi:hypothetical protein